jgi:hypothetical protein
MPVSGAIREKGREDMRLGEVVQILIGFGALVAFLTGFSALRQRQRLEYLRESVRVANERLEDLAERQDALPLPSTAIDQELRPSSADPLSWLIMTMSVAAAVATSWGYLLIGREGLLRNGGALGWFAATALSLILITAIVGLIDLLWGMREKRLALLHYTSRRAAAVMLRTVILARLVLVQQLHRALADRLYVLDEDADDHGQHILALIAATPRLLTGAGVPPWLIKRAGRSADRLLASEPHAFLAARPAAPGDLARVAARADLVLRQFRPTDVLWSALDRHAEDLRRRLPEWEWTDLMCAWTSAGILPSEPATLRSYDADVTSRLEALDHRRAIGIHAHTRDVDSRDLAAWNIASTIAVRAHALSRSTAGSEAPWHGTLWDLPLPHDPSAPQDGPTTGVIPKQLMGFQSRDPIVWIGLAQPSVARPLDWVEDHIEVRDGAIRWRQRRSGPSIEPVTRTILGRPATGYDERRTVLDGALADHVWGEPVRDLVNLGTMRYGGATDMADLFKRYASDDTRSVHPKPTLRARAGLVVSVLRLFPLYPPALKTILLLFIAAVLALAFLS